MAGCPEARWHRLNQEGLTDPRKPGGHMSREVFTKRTGTNPHPNVSLDRAIYEIKKREKPKIL